MTERQKARVPRMVLRAVGVLFVFGVAPLIRIWPSGRQGQPNRHEYEEMVPGVHATLGVFLILAAKAPGEHRSLVPFAAWSSIVHAGIMGIQVIRASAERGHLLGDVPALAVVGIVLLVLTPRAIGASAQRYGTEDRAVDVRVGQHRESGVPR